MLALFSRVTNGQEGRVAATDFAYSHWTATGLEGLCILAAAVVRIKMNGWAVGRLGLTDEPGCFIIVTLDPIGTCDLSSHLLHLASSATLLPPAS